MLEKRLIAVPPQLFIANGTTDGKVTVVDSSLFKVKQQIIIKSNAQGPTNDLEIKRIPNINTIEIGPKGKIDTRSDLSLFIVADQAAIFANEQLRPSIPLEEYSRAVYEEEPVVADRVILVDELGEKYNETNRLPVEATVNLTASKPNKHTIFNQLITNANTEYSVLLPANTEIFTVMVRSNKAIKLQYTFTAGESNTKYITVMPGVRKEVSGVGLTTATPLYMQLSSTEVGGTIVEIEAWNF